MESVLISTEPLSETPSRFLPEKQLEEALVYCAQARFSTALVRLLEAARLFREHRNVQGYVECTTHLIRIYAEQELSERVNALERELLHVITTESLEPKTLSRAYYVLGVCNSISDGPHTLEAAFTFFNKSIEAALKDHVSALAHPLYGLALHAYILGRYAEAAVQLRRLDVILESHPVLELSISSALLGSLIDRNEGRLDSALNRIWEAYRLLRGAPRLLLYIQAVHALGSVYLQKSDHVSAAIYLRLASEAVERTELPRLARMVDQSLAKLHAARSDDGIAFDSERDTLRDVNGQTISFAGQMILRRLFTILLEADGVVVSKERLAREVWGEAYDTRTLDNKIYVTIRRLRKLLSPIHPLGTGVIRRAEGGYVMDSRVKFIVSVEEEK